MSESQIIISGEIRSNDGGKEALIDFFDFLKKQNKLINSFQEKISISFFIFDKDIDDIKKKKKRSQHILYTEYYCLENYFYIYGDLARASAISSSFPIGLFEHDLSNSDSWRFRSASYWKEWIKLCIFSSLFCSHGSECTYGVNKSKIHSGAYTLIDENRYELCKNHLKQQSSMQEMQFNLEYQKISERVDRIFERGKFDSIFSGKWYKHFLLESINYIVSPRKIINKNCLPARLETSLQQTLNSNDEWTRYFKQPIENILICAGLMRHLSSAVKPEQMGSITLPSVVDVSRMSQADKF
jgi:hypothetical protein